MAKSLRLKVIAEGVENEAQLSFLRAHQCDEIQGYYFSKPLAVDKVADKLRGTAVQVLFAKHGARLRKLNEPQIRKGSSYGRRRPADSLGDQGDPGIPEWTRWPESGLRH
jgi:hypothetical protein